MEKLIIVCIVVLTIVSIAFGDWIIKITESKPVRFPEYVLILNPAVDISAFNSIKHIIDDGISSYVLQIIVDVDFYKSNLLGCHDAPALVIPNITFSIERWRNVFLNCVTDGDGSNILRWSLTCIPKLYRNIYWFPYSPKPLHNGRTNPSSLIQFHGTLHYIPLETRENGVNNNCQSTNDFKTFEPPWFAFFVAGMGIIGFSWGWWNFRDNLRRPWSSISILIGLVFWAYGFLKIMLWITWGH